MQTGVIINKATEYFAISAQDKLKTGIIIRNGGEECVYSTDNRRYATFDTSNQVIILRDYKL